jgi:hypothetical protein
MDTLRRTVAAGSVLLVGAGAIFVGLAGLDGAQAAKGRAKVTVTISQVNTEMSGKVISPKPVKCAKDRTVWVWEQIGTRGGGDDVKRFQDTTSLQGSSYVWNTGNTGEEGFFYAKVAPKPGCKGDTSPTIEAVRNED